MSDVYVHIGLAKTGTTSIQMALQESVAGLTEHDVEFVGAMHQVQRMAVYDLLGRRIEGDQVHDVAGAWPQLVEQIDAATAKTVVISEELLSLSRPRQVRRLVKSLADHRVFVVVGVRDYGRSIPSAWQQEIVKGHTFSWGEYIASIRDPSEGPATAGVAFRLRSDLLHILDVWERFVPRQRIRLVTVPPPDSPSDQLLDRFAEALGAPPGVLRGSRQGNEALGAVEVEVLRRLNENLLSELSAAEHQAVVQRSLRASLTGRDGARRLALPPAERSWVTAWTEALLAELWARDYEVHGDLADLSPVFANADQRPLDDVTEDELLRPTEDALCALVITHAALWKRHQRLKGRQEADASLGTRLTSSARAASFGLRMSALERADRNRFLGRLSRLYLRFSSHR